MYAQIFSLMDLIQIIGIVGVSYMCYRSGYRKGQEHLIHQLEQAGVVKIQHEDEGEDKH